MNFVSNDEKHDITFLYKLTRGVCPKSFGMVVASMAGVPLEIIETADRVAGEFEKSQRWQEAQVSASKTGLGLNFKFSSLMQSLKQLAPGSGTSAVKRVDELESVKMIWKGFAAAS